MFTEITHWLQGVVPPDALHADQAIAHFFRDRLTTATSADVLLTLSLFGSEPWVAGILLLLLGYLAFKRHWAGFFVLLLTVPAGCMLGQLLKHLFQRDRPFLSGPWGEWGGHSFPSGHTLAATLLYAALALIFLPKLSRRRWRFVVGAVALMATVAVAFSRVALGAHFFTDVLAAMIFGMIWAGFCALLVHVARKRQVVAISAN